MPKANQQNPDRLARASGFVRIAGVDEAGRGPWAGPVVAAAVILRRWRLAVRIDDSKKLTASQRATAFHVILASADVGIGVVGAEAIDRCRIHRATLLAMRQAVDDLPETPDVVLVDGHFTPPLTMPCWPILHGDQLSYVISCASIVAKVFRDRLMVFYHELDPRYEFYRHKGYGTAAHAAALELFGPSVFHRMSFRPVADQIGAGDAEPRPPRRPEPTTAIVRRGEDAWGGAAAGPAPEFSNAF